MKSMRNIIIVLIIVILLCFFSLACQSTPEEAVILGSNSDSTKDGLVDDKPLTVDQLQVPETWIEDELAVSKTYNITANAQIIVPDIHQCHGIIVKCVPFDATMIQTIANLFVEDLSDIYINDINLSKREIMEMIVRYQQQLTEETIEQDITDLEIENLLAELYAKLETAPESKQEGILDFNSIVGSKEYFGRFVLDNRIMSITGIMNGTSLGIKPRGIIQYDGWQIGENEILKIGDIGIEEDAAKNLANSFIENLMCDNVALLKTTKAQIVEPETAEIIPIYVMTYGKSYNGLSTVDIGLDYTLYPTSSISEYAAPWPQEIISLYISKDKVIGVNWFGSSKIEHVESTECLFLPFIQIQQRIRDQLRYRYSFLDSEQYEGIDRIDISIDEIKLGYCITGIKNMPNVSRLAPAWYVLYREFAEEDGSGTDAVLVIHAETGEVLDPRITR